IYGLVAVLVSMSKGLGFRFLFFAGCFRSPVFRHWWWFYLGVASDPRVWLRGLAGSYGGRERFWWFVWWPDSFWNVWI
ncbi:hypothetical protein A2U01_0069337, partial [Trifolium medium]|nr:hypothetical protein [Trifolium medium]